MEHPTRKWTSGHALDLGTGITPRRFHELLGGRSVVTVNGVMMAPGVR
ncbi:MAG: hypothetical protein JF606_22730 [Burkholderiales bacterium]|nr:hypothetical protein [Burkholderiales bacterium]